MQTNKQVLRAMVESEEVSLQATAEDRERFCVTGSTNLTTQIVLSKMPQIMIAEFNRGETLHTLFHYV